MNKLVFRFLEANSLFCFGVDSKNVGEKADSYTGSRVLPEKFDLSLYDWLQLL